MRFRSCFLKSLTLAATALVATAAIAVFTPACSNQGEGEVCALNSDCQDGLTCVKSPNGTIAMDTDHPYRCCVVLPSGEVAASSTLGCSHQTAIDTTLGDGAPPPMPPSDGGDAAPSGDAGSGDTAVFHDASGDDATVTPDVGAGDASSALDAGDGATG